MSKQPPTLDEKLVEVWKQGGLTTKVIGPLAGNEAIALRHRLYRERIKMRRLNHPDVEIAMQASISISAAEEGKVNLIVYPANLAINQALANAGIVESNDPPPLDDL